MVLEWELLRPQLGLTHAKLVSLTSPCCSGWPAPMNTPQGQQRTAEQQWVCGLQCLIRKWSLVNLKFQFDTQIAYKPTYKTHDLCYIGTDIKFNHTNSVIHSSGHLCGLFTSASDYTSMQWRLVLHILVTCSLHVNKSSIMPGDHACHMVFLGAEVSDP